MCCSSLSPFERIGEVTPPSRARCRWRPGFKLPSNPLVRRICRSRATGLDLSTVIREAFPPPRLPPEVPSAHETGVGSGRWVTSVRERSTWVVRGTTHPPLASQVPTSPPRGGGEGLDHEFFDRPSPARIRRARATAREHCSLRLRTNNGRPQCQAQALGTTSGSAGSLN